MMEPRMKRMATNPLLIVASVAVLCTCSCSTKSMVPRGARPEQYATIQGASILSLTGGAEVVAVDGQSLLFENAVEIPAGAHVVRLCYKGPLGGYLRCDNFLLMAEAGHTYAARGRWRDFPEQHIYLWIEDARTGRVVAGQKP
jgi:hypothetical protein